MQITSSKPKDSSPPSQHSERVLKREDLLVSGQKSTDVSPAHKLVFLFLVAIHSVRREPALTNFSFMRKSEIMTIACTRSSVHVSDMM